MLSALKMKFASRAEKAALAEIRAITPKLIGLRCLFLLKIASNSLSLFA